MKGGRETIGTAEELHAAAREITGLDPTTDVDPNGLDLVWYVRAVEMGTHRIGSFIVDDASGELIWSAFPLPPASELP